MFDRRRSRMRNVVVGVESWLRIERSVHFSRSTMFELRVSVALGKAKKVGCSCLLQRIKRGLRGFHNMGVGVMRD